MRGVVQGTRIVLTSSRSEMSNYGMDPFKAFSCTFPYRLTPYLEKYLQPDDRGDGSALFAPYGLRKVETILSRAFGRENVVVAHHDSLERHIGPATRLLGISTMDPMGIAYVSTTYNSLIGIGGESRNSLEFRRLVEHPSVRRHSPFVLVGGAGGWQIEETGKVGEYGIDMIFHGEAEAELVDVVRRILSGEEVPRRYEAKKLDRDNIPPITAPGTYGSVEMTRGCGRGCHFCTPTMRTMNSVPLERIVEEVDRTVEAGVSSVFLLTEDIFLYRTHPRFIPNRNAIVEMVRSVAERPGVEEIHISHAALAPIVHDPKILEEIMPYLLEKTRRRYAGKPFSTAEVGVETGSRALMRKHMAGKALPFDVNDWPEIVIQGVGNMNDHQFFPLLTLMTGLPGETDDDIIATLELIDEMKDMKAFFTPLLFIPLRETVLARDKGISLENLSELQFEFIARSWKYNVSIWSDTVETPVNVRYLMPPLLIGAHLFWARWRHGPNLTRPLLKLAGFPDSFIGGYVGRWIDGRYAIPDLAVERYAIERGKELRPVHTGTRPPA